MTLTQAACCADAETFPLDLLLFKPAGQGRGPDLYCRHLSTVLVVIIVDLDQYGKVSNVFNPLFIDPLNQVETWVDDFMLTP